MRPVGRDLDILQPRPMSPKDGKGPGRSPVPAKPATTTQPYLPPKPRRQPAAEPPPAVVSRTVGLGAGTTSQHRSPAPDIQIRPPAGGTAPKSVRPTAPDMLPANEAASIAGTFERLLSADVEQGVAGIQQQPKAPPPVDVWLTDFSEVQSLFAQLAVSHTRQVRDFMIDLHWNEATVEWVELCAPALRSLRGAAEQLELRELCTALDRFSAALVWAQASGLRTIDGERRATILERYEVLGTLMPQAFELDLDRSQRESIILQSLLLQVPAMNKATLDKLYTVGLTTLEAMRLATPAALAATAGIDEAIARGIVRRFRDYWAEVNTAVPDATRAHERAKLAELTRRLRREHAAFESAAQDWVGRAEERKKELRKTRAQTLLDIQVLLARLGEVNRLKEIERLPFARKLERLESFLEEARDKYVAQP